MNNILCGNRRHIVIKWLNNREALVLRDTWLNYVDNTIETNNIVMPGDDVIVITLDKCLSCKNSLRNLVNKCDRLTNNRIINKKYEPWK